MSPAGDADLLVAARAALLDALEALRDHRDALILIGAQAIYLHTGATVLAIAEATKDSDLAVDPRVLADDPLIERAMSDAGFSRDLDHPQPGAWLSPAGIPVDLMVPEALAGPARRRSAVISPHGKEATRRAAGLEASVVDHTPMTIRALDPTDTREVTIAVAGPAALLVSKLHKLGERKDEPGRLVDKDAHDIYRLLVATDTAALAASLSELRDDALAGPSVRVALDYLRQLFVDEPRLGASMAGRAEELVGAPDVTSAAAHALATVLLNAPALGPSHHRDRRPSGR